MSQFGGQALQIITTLILARILAPSDYGLLGMAMVFIGFIGIFKDLGFSAVIIQTPNPSNTLLNSLFWSHVGFAALCTMALIVTAPAISWFYHEPRLTSVLQILSISFVLSGIGLPHGALLKKNLQFKIIAFVEISALCLGSAAGITAAFLGMGVWALVYQNLAHAFITSILLWMKSAWIPRFRFSWKEMRDVLSYSLNLTGYNIFNYFARNADYLIIGRYLGAQELGYYTIAYRLMLYPLRNITAVISRVLFPALAQIQNDNVRFGKIYLKVCFAIAIIVFPLMTGLWVVADSFVLVVLGARWEPVGFLLLILSPVGIIQSIGATVGTIYQAKGRTDWLFKWGLLSGSFLIGAFFVGLKWGITGVASAYLIAGIILAYPNFAIPFKLINLKFASLLGVLMRPFACSLIMLFIILMIKSLFTSRFGFNTEFYTLVFVGAVIYLSASWMLNRQQLRELLAII